MLGLCPSLHLSPPALSLPSAQRTPLGEMNGDHSSDGNLPDVHGATGVQSPGQQARSVTTGLVDGSGSNRPEAIESRFSERELITAASGPGEQGHVRLRGKVNPERVLEREYGQALKNVIAKMEMSADGNDFEPVDTHPRVPSLSRAPAQTGGCSGKDHSASGVPGHPADGPVPEPVEAGPAGTAGQELMVEGSDEYGSWDQCASASSDFVDAGRQSAVVLSEEFGGGVPVAGLLQPAGLARPAEDEVEVGERHKSYNHSLQVRE